MNKEVTAYIEDAPYELRAIMEELRSLIHEVVGGAKETYKWSRPVFNLTTDFAYIQLHKNHVNLGFFKDFERLKATEGILEGTGKAMRHIKLKSTADINKKLLREWLIVLTT